MTKAKVLCILNHRGGVGKTTTTINLGGTLQQKGYKVLLIDLDGQTNLTESMGLSAELPQTIYGAMKGEYPLPIYQHKDGMSVVPSCLDLSAVEMHIPVYTRSPIPVIPVHSVCTLLYLWQS